MLSLKRKPRYEPIELNSSYLRVLEAMLELGEEAGEDVFLEDKEIRARVGQNGRRFIGLEFWLGGLARAGLVVVEEERQERAGIVTKETRYRLVRERAEEGLGVRRPLAGVALDGAPRSRPSSLAV